jgi:hypothetical protein
MESVIVPEAAPLPGVTWSQFPPVTGITLAMKVAPVAELASVMDCDAGVGPPCGCVKTKGPGAAGVAVTVMFDVTVKVTGIVTAAGKVGELMVIEPV